MFDATETSACLEGQKLMNRASKPPGTTQVGGTEDRRFRSAFGRGVETVLDVWTRMRRGGSVPEQGGFNHLLWALMFMSVYPRNENKMCTLLGGRRPPNDAEVGVALY
jgi:hypothetical protein